MNILRLSKMTKTWIIDIDGVIFPHNGYLANQRENPLDGVKKFFNKISSDDYIILITSRHTKYRNLTERNLSSSGLRYNILLMGMPKGERIVINDVKASGLRTAFSICLERDAGFVGLDFLEDETL